MVKSAGRQYTKEFLLAMTGYVVVLLVSTALVNISPRSAWWRIPFALLPIIPVTFALIAYIRFVRRMDELQRRIHFEGIALAFAAVAMLTFSYGFLEFVGFPPINMIYILPLMILFWGLGLSIASRRYQ